MRWYDLDSVDDLTRTAESQVQSERLASDQHAHARASSRAAVGVGGSRMLVKQSNFGSVDIFETQKKEDRVYCWLILQTASVSRPQDPYLDMATASGIDVRTGDSAAEGLQESRIPSVKQQSMYKTPDDYFFHTKTHIDEGDIVIVFMVSS